jgi:hypothetical protein
MIPELHPGVFPKNDVDHVESLAIIEDLSNCEIKIR